jgi:hypothetical protein
LCDFDDDLQQRVGQCRSFSRAHTSLAHEQVLAAEAAASDVIVRLDNRHRRSASFSEQVLTSLLRLMVMAKTIMCLVLLMTWVAASHFFSTAAAASTHMKLVKS